MDIPNTSNSTTLPINQPSDKWGDAPEEIKSKVRDLILSNSKDLPKEDRTILLAIAKLESGFNPNAQAKTTTAAGVFQIIKSVGNNLGLPQEDRYDARKNIIAGIRLYKENLQILKKRFPNAKGNERAILLYALHHDGPSLKYGGAEIARRVLIPYLREFRKSNLLER